MKKSAAYILSFLLCATSANAQFKEGMRPASLGPQASAPTLLPIAEIEKPRPKTQSVKIAAIVNGDILSSQDLQNRVNAFLMTTQIPLNAQTQGMIMQKVLHSAIDEKIKLQEATKNGIIISAQEIKNSLQSYEANNKISLAQMLKQSGVSKKTFEKQMESDLAWIRLVRKKMLSDNNITQKEIEVAQKEAIDDLNTKKFLISEIVIEKNKAKNLSELVSNLRTDNRFGLYALQFSESVSASNGGSLGWVNDAKLPEQIRQTVNKMQKGDISEPILIGDSYYIIKLEQLFDPKEDKQPKPDQKEIKRFLENQKMEAFSKKYLQDLRQKAVIEIRN